MVPRARVAVFREKFSDPAKVNAEAMNYWALYDPAPTWRWLTVKLYGTGEAKAAQIAKHHIYVVTGM